MSAVLLQSACTKDDISIKTHILYIHRGTYSDCFCLVQIILEPDRIWLPATCEVKWTLSCTAEADCFLHRAETTAAILSAV